MREQIRQAVAVLTAGGVIAHPTETVFGLAADPTNRHALDRLLALKGRQPNKGLILLIPDRSVLNEFLQPRTLIDPGVQALMDRFWPGPLTLVLPARPGLPAPLTGGGDFIAVRHSPSPLVADLLAVWGAPLVSTSANFSGQPVLNDHQAVLAAFGAQVGVVIAGCCSASAQPSTVVIMDPDRGRMQLLRSGEIALAVIRGVLMDQGLFQAEDRRNGGETHRQSSGYHLYSGDRDV
ncbi:MAG: threonylcarbamoyl-AMP synthase [Magnetococcales bacterium]|nr:threonylcarbamoyl-AMP synthase [Magnetococcales bacterium]